MVVIVNVAAWNACLLLDTNNICINYFLIPNP
jgi:hypothetical protein